MTRIYSAMIILLLVWCGEKPKCPPDQNVHYAPFEILEPEVDSSVVEFKIFKMTFYWMIQYRYKGQDEWQHIPELLRPSNILNKGTCNKSKLVLINMANIFCKDPKKLQQHINHQYELYNKVRDDNEIIIKSNP